MLLVVRHWIPNPRFWSSKPLGGSKVDSAFHPFEVDQMSTKNYWGLRGKNTLNYCVGVQQDKSYIMPRRCFFGLC